MIRRALEMNVNCLILCQAELSEDLRQLLVKKAYSVTYGARNLRRTIQRELEDPISERIIDSFEHPISAIHISVAEDTVTVALPTPTQCMISLPSSSTNLITFSLEEV